MHISQYILYFYCSFNYAASNSDRLMPDFLPHNKKLTAYDVGGSGLGTNTYSSPEFAWGPQKDYHSLSRERWSPFKNMKSCLVGKKQECYTLDGHIRYKLPKKKKKGYVDFV